MCEYAEGCYETHGSMQIGDISVYAPTLKCENVETLGYMVCTGGGV
jgi:hypothetical protein